MTNEMTSGSPAKHILKFCLPLMAGNLFQQLYNMVDTILVGRVVGKTALSAVGSVGSLNFLVIGSIVGLCGGLAIPIAQRFGAKDYDGLRKCFANTIYVAVAVGAVFTALAVSCAGLLLRLLNTPEDIYSDAYNYIIIIFAGIGATMLYNIMASIIRALGDSRTPLLFLVLSSVLNVILDYVLMKYVGLGVRGAAIATIASQAISGVLCVFFVQRKLTILRFDRRTGGFEWKTVRQLLRYGLPMALQFSITATGSVMLQSCVNGLGPDVIAAVTIAGKAQLMIIIPSETIGLTMSTYCGQNLGARQPTRIKKGIIDAVLLALAYSVIAILIARLSGEYVALLFLRDADAIVLSLVGRFLDTCSWFYPILVVLFVLRNSLQGLGYSVTSMMGGVFELVARAIAGFGFVTKYGYPAVCLANPMAWLAADVLFVPALLVAMRKLLRTVEKTEKRLSDDMQS